VSDETTREPEQEQRIRFGSRPNQSVPLAWAEVILMELADVNPVLMGKLLVKAAGLSTGSRRRGADE